MEEVAWPESLLKTAALLFDLAAPVEFQAESVVLCVSAARGVAARVIPSPVAVMAASALTNLGMMLLLIKPADLVGVDGGAVAPRFVDPPSAWGSHLVQGLCGGAAEAHAGGACISSEKKLGSRTRTYLFFSCFPGFICHPALPWKPSKSSSNNEGLMHLDIIIPVKLRFLMFPWVTATSISGNLVPKRRFSK